MEILNDENKFVNFTGAVEVIRADMNSSADVKAQ
jgi:hypothetical protein